LTSEGKKLNSSARFRAFHDLPMKHEFKLGDPVDWKSKAGRVLGTARQKDSAQMKLQPYTVHVSKEEGAAR